MNQILGKEVPHHRQSGHNYKGVFSVQIFFDCVVHENAQLLSWFDQHGSKQVGYLFEIEVGGLAQVDGQDMGEGGVVSQGLEIDEFDEDVRVLFGLGVGVDLCFDKDDFLLDNVLLDRFVFGLSDEFDEGSGFLAEGFGCFFVLE